MPPSTFTSTSTRIISLDDYYATKATLDAAIAESRATARAKAADPQAQGQEQHEESEERVTVGLFGIKEIVNMPVHPAEEETGGNLTDMVAKQSSDSTASDHPLHQEESSGATSGGAESRAKAEDFKATPGPVIAQDLPKPESRENLEARAKELNQDNDSKM